MGWVGGRVEGENEGGAEMEPAQLTRLVTVRRTIRRARCTIVHAPTNIRKSTRLHGAAKHVDAEN